jgi:hypothetical protein
VNVIVATVLVLMPFEIVLTIISIRHPLVHTVQLVVFSMTLALAFAIAYYPCRKRPSGWLVHVTTSESLGAMRSAASPGCIHLKSGGPLGRMTPLVGSTNPWRKRLYFFDQQPTERWVRFNLGEPDEFVTVSVRAEHLPAHGRFYRRLFDHAWAWDGGDYLGPARIGGKPGVTF